MGYAPPHDREALEAARNVLQRITHIVDADGFTVNGFFFPREMTVLRLADNLMVRYEFRLPCKKKQLSEKDYKVANFVRDNINGMQFSDEYWSKDKERWQAMLPASHDAPIKCLLDMAQLSGAKPCLFAYKGGQHERRWLEQANLPSINLEVLGCPRFDQLLSQPDNAHYAQLAKASHAVFHYRLTTDVAKCVAVACDMHVRWQARYPPHKPIHCPASECRVFHLWITRRLADLSRLLGQ